jgi:hypothetical protein
MNMRILMMMIENSAIELLDCHRLRQIPWLIDIAAAEVGDVVGEELEGDDAQEAKTGSMVDRRDGR